MKTVLITGGSTGIGAGIVKEFSKAGYSVIFTYKNHKNEAEILAKEYGTRAYFCDITKLEDINTLKKKINNVDIVINNAGISDIKMCSLIDEDDWDNIVNTNLKGAFFISKAFIQGMIDKGFGRIINIGSMWGISGASCEVHYSAAKAGLTGLTKSLAKELGPSGITVNLIAPGIIDTEMNRKIETSALNELIASCPVSRMGKPEDIANLALFLASENSSFITGTVIPVDGGYTI